MLLFLLAYLGGILTILSPCILPVLPFVFARADRPFLRNGLPLLAGMAITFAGVATLAAVGGGWAVAANSVGRWIALVLLAGFALLLIFPAPLGARDAAAGRPRASACPPRAARTGIGGSLLLGVATGLLWAPCAGPILGIILTGAALSGASADHRRPAARLCAGRRDQPRRCALLVGGKRVRGDEALDRRRRRRPQGARRADPGRRRHHRARPRHAGAGPAVDRPDLRLRASPRPAARHGGRGADHQDRRHAAGRRRPAPARRRGRCGSTRRR